MIDIIHVMKTSAPSLLPILRSDLQGEVMALLFSHPEQQYTVSQIADATRASLPTVSREVNRLEQSGLVTVQNVGRTRMVQAKVDNPVGQAMRQLILVTYGPVPVLRDTLHGHFQYLRVPLFMARGLAVVLGWLGTCRMILMCWLLVPLHVRSCMRLLMMLSRSLAMR